MRRREKNLRRLRKGPSKKQRRRREKNLRRLSKGPRKKQRRKRKELEEAEERAKKEAEEKQAQADVQKLKEFAEKRVAEDRAKVSSLFSPLVTHNSSRHHVDMLVPALPITCHHLLVSMVSPALNL